MAIEIRSLKFYPKLYCVFTDAYRQYLLSHMNSNCPNKKMPETIIKSYACFLHIITGSENKFDNLKAQNNANFRLTHIKCYIGFCISETETTESMVFEYSKRIYAALIGKDIVIKADMPVSKDDFAECVAIYKKIKRNDLVEYYEGWKATSFDQKVIRLHLAFLYDSTSKEFTDFVHEACINYLAKHKKPFSDSCAQTIVKFFKQIVEIYKDSDSIILSISEKNISKTVEMILHFDLINARQSNHKDALRNLIRNSFPSKVRLYRDIFIETNLIGEPIRQIIIPTLKGIKNAERYHSSGGGISRDTMARLTSGIPLDIPNDEAFEIIKHRLLSDISHIRHHSLNLIRKINKKHKSVLDAIENGQIKPIPKHGANLGGKCGAVTYPFGKRYLQNTIATFYHYGFKGVPHYGTFLTSKGNEMNNSELIEELNIPTLKTIYPFLLLIVHEHPNLVPSSFENWNLYDSNGRLTGYKESNGVMLINTFKYRRGSKKAAQQIPTTKLSRLCVEMLIEHTRYCRDFLKSKGDPNWKKMLLVSRSINSKPTPVKFVRRGHDSYGDLFSKFENPIVKCKGNWIVDTERTVDMYVSLRSLRSTIAVYKYLKTNSLKVFHETLGHSKSYNELVDSYIPDVLQRYIQERDIRTFQNTVIYLSMKENPLLDEVLDKNIIDIDTFFSKHGFSVHDDNNQEQKNESYFDNLELIITTPLLQIMLYILKLDIKEHNLNPFTFERWKTLSLYVITHIKLSIENETKYQVSDEIKKMYKDALYHELKNITLRSSHGQI
ncbi:hypothetical protein LG772_000193 [Vibrio parahaemolyticus]|nr:hypothetical protein [Vibrio parahaemolyticus]